MTYIVVEGPIGVGKTVLTRLLGERLAMPTVSEQYEGLSKQGARPDLVVYLRASVDTLMARIYQRDRWFERSMERPYIERLSQVYESFFDTYSESPLLKIETDDLDLVRDVKAQQE